MSVTEQAAKTSDQKYCAECGSIISIRAEICPKCGVRQLASPGASAGGLGVTASGRSKIAAGLFALLLGGIGIHKFYLGRIGWGIVYILFCWTFIPTLIAFVEGIVYLTMSDEAFARKYG